MRRLSLEEFLDKAITQHKGRYSYDRVKYVNSQKKVTITCHEHGEFEQTPNKHLMGRGCRKCRDAATSERFHLTLKGFITKANQKHGGKYTYANAVYVNSHARLLITCPVHGDFKQVAHDHLSGYGCPSCGLEASRSAAKSRLLSSEKFIEKAHQKHKGRYTYTNTVYTDSKTKVIITCSEHGDFKQAPNSHLGGRGCPVCGRLACAESRRSNLEEFIKEANQKHKGKYTYLNAVYIGAITKLWVTCPEQGHGEFAQIPVSHLRGRGCPKCAGHELSTTEGFVNKARTVHNGKYTYVNAVYVNAMTKLWITCPKHGEFKQTPAHHHRGVGCPRCNESKGESAIYKILDTCGVGYVPQYQFSGCRFKQPLPFDFALIKSDVVVGLIEYHGEQHYSSQRFWGISAARAVKAHAGIQRRDRIKKQFALDHNIPLLVIPHWDFDNIPSEVMGFLRGWQTAGSLSFCGNSTITSLDKDKHSLGKEGPTNEVDHHEAPDYHKDDTTGAAWTLLNSLRSLRKPPCYGQQSWENASVGFER